MKIKSLLLGSAAALAITTGAHAADAIMAAEPEAVDYVRVCDAFGTGFFYIPGTETCLKIGGYIRQDIGFGDLSGIDTDFDGRGDSTFFRSRFSFQTDTRSNTELGVLRTFTEVRFQFDNTGVATPEDLFLAPLFPNILGNDGAVATVFMPFAFIELGGFRVGKTESEFTRLSFYGKGYAGGVISDTLVPYGPFGTQQISYTYKSDVFSAVLAVEDDQTGDGNYMPDVLGGVAYNNGTFGAALIGAYDESVGEGAVKARIDAKFGKVSAFLMGGWSSNGDASADIETRSNHFAAWGGDWAVWGGISGDLTDKVSANLQLSYDDVSTFGAAGNLVFHVVPGFDITTEVDYKRLDYDEYDYSADAWGGYVRFQRTF